MRLLKRESPLRVLRLGDRCPLLSWMDHDILVFLLVCHLLIAFLLFFVTLTGLFTLHHTYLGPGSSATSY